MLILNGVKVQLNKKQWRYTWQFNTTGTYVLLGRSGSGKTTFLNTIAGFTTTLSGEITWQKQIIHNLEPSKRPITSLFQQNNLFNHLSVFSNVALGIKPNLKLTNEDRTSIRQVLLQVGLQDYEDRLPTNLSGGEQQRVALARCLLRRKPILLLDEPFSALDATTRSEMTALLKDLINEHQLCTILVTHDPNDGKNLDATILTMSDQGTIFSQ